jgi:hypothetical protein
VPFTRFNGQTYHESGEPQTRRQRELTTMFNVAVLGMKQPPEEPCHKCVRLYGIYTGEMSTAYRSVEDSFADAGYASSDALNASDTIKLMAKEGCLTSAVDQDVDEIVKKITEANEGNFGKDDVERALDELQEIPVLEEVVKTCKVGIPN